MATSLGIKNHMQVIMELPVYNKGSIIKRIIILSLLLISTMSIKAQTIATRYEASGAYGSGTYAPFWHMANRQGLGSEKTGMGYARVGAQGNHPFKKSGITLDWGADIVGGMNMTSAVFVQQAYVECSWRKLRLSVGQKERWGELVNHRLSTGSLVESGNARPIPQVRLELHDYWNIPGTNGWLAIKGHLAYGRFTDGGWQERFVAKDKQRATGVLYHSKEGLMRFGNTEKFPLTAEIGIHMVTQFGGTIYNWSGAGNTVHAPRRLKDYFLALIPLKGDEQYVAPDQANVAGNVLGSWKGAITWNVKEWMLRLYYDHVFEDHSQMFWEYGLWTEQLVGLELNLKEFKWIKSATIEYFNLKNQSGPIYHDSNSIFPDQISCRDNNYWHHTYGGWFNYGQMIGTPLCTSPIYNKNHTLGIYNTRVEAFHFGIEGDAVDWLGYRVLYTRSNNWGTYGKPFKDIKINRSAMVELTVKPQAMRGWSVAASFALDRGDLYGNNYGGLLTVKGENLFNIGKEEKR